LTDLSIGGNRVRQRQISKDVRVRLNEEPDLRFLRDYLPFLLLKNRSEYLPLVPIPQAKDFPSPIRDQPTGLVVYKAAVGMLPEPLFRMTLDDVSDLIEFAISALIYSEQQKND